MFKNALVYSFLSALAVVAVSAQTFQCGDFTVTDGCAASRCDSSVNPNDCTITYDGTTCLAARKDCPKCVDGQVLESSAFECVSTDSNRRNLGETSAINLISYDTSLDLINPSELRPMFLTVDYGDEGCCNAKALEALHSAKLLYLHNYFTGQGLSVLGTSPSDPILAAAFATKADLCLRRELAGEPAPASRQLLHPSCTPWDPVVACSTQCAECDPGNPDCVFSCYVATGNRRRLRGRDLSTTDAATLKEDCEKNFPSLVQNTIAGLDNSNNEYDWGCVGSALTCDFFEPELK